MSYNNKYYQNYHIYWYNNNIVIPNDSNETFIPIKLYLVITVYYYNSQPPYHQYTTINDKR